MQLFGWKLERNKQEDLVSFVPKQDEDGALSVDATASGMVAAGGIQAVAVDIDGNFKNEGELVSKYREMSLQPEVKRAIEEIVNEFVAWDSDEDIVNLNLDRLQMSVAFKKRINAEFAALMRLLDFNNRAYEVIRRWYIDGRLNYHLILDKEDPARGIREMRYIDPRTIRKIREVQKVRRNTASASQDLQLDRGEYYVYNPRGFEVKSVAGTAETSVNGIKIAADSILTITSGLMNADNSVVLSYLHDAIKPMNQLRNLEDAAVIYRLTRSSERRIFYIDVGNLPKMKAEQYLNDIMAKFKNKVVYDPGSGQVRDARKFMTMTEDYWLPRREGGKGTEITTMPGGQNLGEMEDVLYFQKRLYRSLNVPLSRLESDAGFNIGRSSEISRDELNFQKFITRLRVRFSMGLKELLKRQLLLKRIASDSDVDSIIDAITIEYQRDNYFTEMKELEVMRERLAVLQQMDDMVGKYFSRESIKKKILRQTDSEIKEEQERMDSESLADQAAQSEMLPPGGEDGPGADPDSGDENNQKPPQPQDPRAAK